MVSSGAPTADRGVDLDGILSELGSFGRYQVRNYLCLLLPILAAAVYNTQYIFNAAATEHRCVVPECEGSPASWVPGEWGEWALPAGDGGRCSRLQPKAPDCDPTVADCEPTTYECSPDGFYPNRTVSCHAWVYENHNTIVSAFDLACEEWKRTLVGTVHSAGLFAALPLTGYLSDTFGRRTALVLTAVCASISGLIRAFSVNYAMYLVFEFLDATLGSGVYSTGFVLAVEMVGVNKRVLGGNIVSSSWALGQVVTALVAWAVPYWRTFTVIVYAPSLLFGFYFFVLEESVRWLLSRGNKREAARIIFKAADINAKKLSAESIRQLTEDETPAEKERKDSEAQLDGNRSMFIQVLRSRIILCRVAVCSFWWMTTTFVYYGLSINSVSLAGNMYVNYILTALVEIPGYGLSVLTLDRFGRKYSSMTAYIICGLSLVTFPFIPEEVSWARTSLNMAGKLCISMAFSSIYIYTSELFPTAARHRLLSVCSMIGRIGAIVAPQTPLLMSVWVSLPYLVFGALSVTAGLLMLLTPETLDQRLPDTIHEAETISKRDRTIGS